MKPKTTTLYSGGKVWTIKLHCMSHNQDVPCVVSTTYGKIEGKKQTTSRPIFGHERAEKWYELQIRKKREKGYAPKGEKSSMTNGIWPMLAKKLSKAQMKGGMEGWLLQPKLDGIRCIAEYTKKGWKFWSRTRKPLPSFPQIVRELDELEVPSGTFLDGELYNHEYIRANCFDDFSGIVRSGDDPDEIVQYHVYDMPDPFYRDTPYTERMVDVSLLLGDNTRGHVVAVETSVIEKPGDLASFFESYVDDGYEGVMLRDPDGHYNMDSPTARSAALLKYKNWDTTEFKIVDVIPGNGKASVEGRFVYEVRKGLTGTANYTATRERRSYALKNKKKFIGKYATIRHLGYCADGRPRNATAVAVRDYE